MANTCDNKLKVWGPEQEIERFIKKAASGKEHLQLQNFRPMPSELEGTESPDPNPESEESRRLRNTCGYSEWYEWRVNNWGIKWEIRDATAKLSKNSQGEACLTYRYETSWNPISDSLLGYIAEQFPRLNLQMTYEEPLMLLKGRRTIMAREVTQTV